MPSKLILDPAEPGINEVISGAKVGQPIVLREITIVPTTVDPAMFEADVTRLSVDAEDEDEGEMQTGVSTEPETIPSDEGGFDKGGA